MDSNQASISALHRGHLPPQKQGPQLTKASEEVYGLGTMMLRVSHYSSQAPVHGCLPGTNIFLLKGWEERPRDGVLLQ